MESGLRKSLSKAFDRAMGAVGTLTLLLSCGVFGFGSAVWGRERGLWLGLGGLGLFGALELFHRQSQTKLMQRCQPLNINALFQSACQAKPSWKTKTFQEFTHGGLFFRTVGFENVPVPLAIAGPLCPACHDHLAQRAEVRFPGRARITFVCKCGRVMTSARSKSELIDEAAKLGGLPE